ncbi:MAG TPA: hypothetical protein IAC62_10460 [Candidatus Pelethocola excrementipullorum]|nr:hypothetical protein [Candidatus Pelethocola excrementipullorum]
MALTKTVDKTLVHGSEVFIYTFNVSFSDLSVPAQNGTLEDFFPSKILFTLPQTEGVIKNIIQTPVAEGTNVTYEFGSVNVGTSFTFTVGCEFGPGRLNGDTFTNSASLYADGVLVSEAVASTVTLLLEESFILKKELIPMGLIRPDEELTFRLTLNNVGDSGASINNVVITDVLPQGLVPVTGFAPVGYDIPEGGYSDSSLNGRTGVWNGNVMTFTLSEYHGIHYQIIFKVKVSSDVIPGQTLKNTAGWTVDGALRPDSDLFLHVFGPDDIMGIVKTGNRTGAIGKPIFYSITNSNQDTEALNDYVLIDSLPDEVDIIGLNFITEALLNYNIYITTSEDPGALIPVITNHRGNSGYIDLSPYIPARARVLEVQVSAPVLSALGSGHTLNLYGIVNNTAVPMETIVNTATAKAENISGTVTYHTIINGASDLALTKNFSPKLSAYYPLDEFKIVLTAGPLNTFTINPVFADLMPNVIHYIENSEYFVYIQSSTGITYDSRLPDFPVPLPTKEIIPDFEGTGQVLLRWSFTNFTLPMGDKLQVIFTSFVDIVPAGTFVNQAFLGNPGDDVLFVYTPSSDSKDYDNDGITDESISGVETDGVILTNSGFSIRKQVKGSLDLEYDSSGKTTAGGVLTYRLLVTNNQLIDLKSLELVDIFPYIGDTGVILTSSSRGSDFFVYPTTAITAEIVNVLGNPVVLPQDVQIWYSLSNDPLRFDELGNSIGAGDWSLIPPADITTIRSVKITTGPDVILHPYDRLIVSIQAKTPVGAAVGDMAYNSFAVRGNKIIHGVEEPMLPTEPNKVGVQIVSVAGGSIGQFVWEDLNGNGIYDSGEPGINGIVVELYNEEMELIDTTVTANNQAMEPGYYLFNNLPPGSYFVKFTSNGRCDLTIQRLGVKNGSVPDPSTGFTPVISLAVNQNRTDINAGYICCKESPYNQAVNDLIESVALEQAALSHILNAEGEKIQKTLELETDLTELIKVNQSVKKTIDLISQLELVLSAKLRIFEHIICEDDCQ